MFTKLKGCYRASHVEELERLESYFHFDSFQSSDVLALSNLIIDCAKGKGEIAFAVIREKDQVTVFQYVDESKGERNLFFAMGKRKCTLKTGHMSCWALVKHLVDGGLDEVIAMENGCMPVAGAFPIFSGNEHKYTVCISGLKDGGDLALMLEALSKYLNVEPLTFSGVMM